MKKFKIIFAFAVCFAIAMPATAQLGAIKSLKDKNPFAKKAVQEEKYPEAKKSDPELEALMLDLFTNSNNFKSGRFDIVEILKLVIVDSDWHLRRHELSGIVTDRYIRAAIAAKGKDGKCGYYRVSFQQDFVGGQYEPVKYSGAGDRYMIKCEDVE